MKKLAAISVLALTASCATAFEEKRQHVQVNIEPAAEAKCNIVGNDFQVEDTAPGVIQIRRSYYPVNITCTTADGRVGSAKVFSDVSNMGYAGSVLGLGVGGVVDASTGHAFEYPDIITIKLGQSQQIGISSMNSNVEFE